MIAIVIASPQNFFPPTPHLTPLRALSAPTTATTTLNLPLHHRRHVTSGGYSVRPRSSPPLSTLSNPSSPPDLFYNDLEAKKYTTSSRIQNIQASMTNRCLDLLDLPGPSFV